VTAKRFGALLVAVALVVGALILRNTLNANTSSGTDSTGGTPSKGSQTLICSTEFAAVCAGLGAAIDVTVEPAGTTLDRLAQAPDGDLPDAWLTLDPFPAMLEQTRTRTGFASAVASSNTVAVTDPKLTLLADRAGALQASCGSAMFWKCVGDFAGSQWTDHGGKAEWTTIKPSFQNPASEAIGLLVLANFVAGYFASSDISAKPLEGDPNLARWLRSLGNNVAVTASGTTPLITLLTRGSALNVATTDTAELSTVAEAQTAKYATLAAAPVIQLRAVLARLSRANTGDLLAQVGALLTKSGWGSPNFDQPTLSESTFITLRQLWKDTNK